MKKNRTYPGLIALMESAPLVDFTPAEAEVFRAAYDEALTIAVALLEGCDGKGEVPDAAVEQGPTATVVAPRVLVPPAPGRSLRDDVLDARRWPAACPRDPPGGRCRHRGRSRLRVRRQHPAQAR
ncbi:hypothetical protein AB0K68_32605 [Streptomyces sp. NPDC050698]